MRSILVTGGIGSGKSLVCDVFQRNGIPVFDSDTMARSLYARYPDLVAEVARQLGPEVLDGDCGIDRKALAKVVFSDPEKLKILESIVHPAVYKDFEVFKAANVTVGYVVFESAIALQRGYPEGMFDEVVFVDAPLAKRIERAALRDRKSREEIMERVDAQPSAAGDPRITRVLHNDGSVEDLERATMDLLEILKNE